MKQPESTWHSVQAEMQARLATLHSQAVSKQKAGKMEIQEHYAEFIKSCEVRMTKVYKRHANAAVRRMTKQF